MKQKTQTNEDSEIVASSQMGRDLKNAVFIVSVLVNLVVLVTWVALQVTSKYDAQMASFLFG